MVDAFFRADLTVFQQIRHGEVAFGVLDLFVPGILRVHIVTVMLGVIGQFDLLKVASLQRPIPAAPPDIGALDTSLLLSVISLSNGHSVAKVLTCMKCYSARVHLLVRLCRTRSFRRAFR